MKHKIFPARHFSQYNYISLTVTLFRKNESTFPKEGGFALF